MRLFIFTTTLLAVNYFSYTAFAQEKLKITRDPTEPQTSYTLDTSTKQFSLQGIINLENKKIAILNDQILEENGKLNNFTVLKINPDNVVLLNNLDGSEITLHLIEADIKNENDENNEDKK